MMRKNTQATRRHRAISILLLLSLAMTLLVASPRNATAVDDDRISEVIESLLADRDYVEGEAIAIVQHGTRLRISSNTEELAEISSEAVEMTADDAGETEGTVDDEAALRMQSSTADLYDVQLVVDHTRTTEQILRDLYANPHVIAAEPNYTMSIADVDAGDTDATNDGATDSPVADREAEAPVADSPAGTIVAAEAAPEDASIEADDPTDAVASEEAAAGTEPDLLPLAASDTPEQDLVDSPDDAAPLTTQAATNPRDLTSLQWGNDDSLSTDANANTPHSPTAGYSMNVPGWAEGRNNENAPANASGTICIMDTGFDANHPDLAGLVYEFSEEQQAQYGCGRYGYNASGDGYGTNVLRPSEGHGTHVAGIVAAAWNGQGTSGGAHGVKIFCVNVFGDTGSTMVMDSVVKGFQFLIDVAQDTNLKAVNCSWGTKQPEFVLTAMINALGQKGVNTIIAAGNDHEDLDETIDLSSQTVSSPYAITVDCAMSNGQSSEFSSYGQNSTDVFAPGTSILSTVPIQVAKYGPDSGLQRFVGFFPQGTAAENLLAYERFDGQPGVLLFDDNPALDPDAQELSRTITSNVGFGDQSSLAIPVLSLNREARSKERFQGFVAETGYAYLAIPVASPESAQAVKWVFASLAMSDAFKPGGAIESLTCTNTAGEIVEVDTAATTALDRGWAASCLFPVYQSQWDTLSFNVDGHAGSYNDAHEMIAEGDTPTSTSEGLGTLPVSDLGEIVGAYGWEHDGTTYVIVKIGVMGDPSAAAQPTESTVLYIDDVALGSADAYEANYMTMSGTSMAAPAVTGSMAVIAKDEPHSSTLTDDELEQEARERAAKLLATVEYDESLSTLCRTGGRVDFSQNPGLTKKAPLIHRAESDTKTLTVSGWFFGTSGSLEIDGEPVTATSWDDEQIQVAADELANGSHVVKVTNADGAISRAVFSYSDEDQGTGAFPLYEKDHAVPVTNPDFATTDRLYVPMVGCNGALYALTATARNLEPQSFWRYDIATDTWERRSLPEGNTAESIHEGGLVVYQGTLYLYGPYSDDGELAFDQYLWRYDADSDTWEELITDAPSSSSLAVLGDHLFFVGGWYGSAFPERDDVHFAEVDVEQRTLVPVKGPDDGIGHGIMLQTATSRDKIYCLVIGDDDEGNTADNLFRLTYSEQDGRMSVEDISTALEQLPALEESAESLSKKRHLALAGLPDGVAVVGTRMNDDGSYLLAQDTSIIYDDATEPTVLDRTSCYHRAFDPVAAYYEGILYATGNSAAEPDAMYFRSTRLWDNGVVTKEPGCEEDGVITYSCLYRDASYTEPIDALGHEWGAWKVTKKPTATSEGTETRTCDHCGKQETRTLPKTSEQVSYRVVQGDGQVWTKGSANGATFTAKRSVDDNTAFGHFTGLSIDDKALDASQYTAKAGSVVATLNRSYLEGLTTGKHTITFTFDDGEATARFSVVAKGNVTRQTATTPSTRSSASTKLPQTDDPLPQSAVMAALVGVALLFLATGLRLRSRTE